MYINILKNNTSYRILASDIKYVKYIKKLYIHFTDGDAILLTCDKYKEKTLNFVSQAIMKMIVF